MRTGLNSQQRAEYGAMQGRIRSQELLPPELRYASTPERIANDTARRARRNEAQARRELAEATGDLF